MLTPSGTNPCFVQFFAMKRSQKDIKLNAAAQTIQRAWRNYKSKPKALVSRVYRSPLALGPPSEAKWLDTQWLAGSELPITTTASYTLLNGMATGDGPNNRDGRRITMISVQLKGRIEPASSTIVAQTCRLLLVYDMQSQAGAPTGTALLTSGGFGLRNLNDRNRFKVLRDIQVSLNPLSSNAGSGDSVFNIDEYLKLNLVTTYDGDTNSVDDISYGGLFLYLSGTSTSTTAARFTGIARIRYKE